MNLRILALVSSGNDAAALDRLGRIALQQGRIVEYAAIGERAECLRQMQRRHGDAVAKRRGHHHGPAPVARQDRRAALAQLDIGAIEHADLAEEALHRIRAQLIAISEVPMFDEKVMISGVVILRCIGSSSWIWWPPIMIGWVTSHVWFMSVSMPCSNALAKAIILKVEPSSNADWVTLLAMSPLP
jgi:hypothetical protein